LTDIFASIIEVLNPPAHIQVRIEGELTVTVTASAQLEQVLRNLINNAIKHHDKQNGEVVLSGKRMGDFVEFVVRDDGPGMPPQFHGKIFQLFQTLKRRDEVEGSGMGLNRAFKAAKISNPVSFAHDGIEALEMLRGTNGRPRLRRPFLILLDLNMPRMDGIEFLRELRKDDELKKSIVFIMTTSDANEDKVKAYNLGVAGYILKTTPANAFLETAALLDTYWRVVEFPAT
jgi:CheY-like chemotaxis protein